MPTPELLKNRPLAPKERYRRSACVAHSFDSPAIQLWRSESALHLLVKAQSTPE